MGIKDYNKGIIQGLKIAIDLIKEDTHLKEFYNYQNKLESMIDSYSA